MRGPHSTRDRGRGKTSGVKGTRINTALFQGNKKLEKKE